MLTQRSSNPRLQLDELKVAAHQFQSAVGSELLVTELDWKLLLDRLPQPPYLQPHLWGLRVVPSGVAAALQTTRQSPLFFDQIVESTRFNFGLRLVSRAYRPYRQGLHPTYDSPVHRCTFFYSSSNILRLSGTRFASTSSIADIWQRRFR